jgi:hypothetical protein
MPRRSHLRDATKQLERDAEKEPFRASQPASRNTGEHVGQPYCAGCSSWECSCTCLDCGVKTQAIRCDVCHEAHQLTVEREQRESLERADQLEAQVGWLETLRAAGAL